MGAVGGYAAHEPVRGAILSKWGFLCEVMAAHTTVKHMQTYRSFLRSAAILGLAVTLGGCNPFKKLFDMDWYVDYYFYENGRMSLNLGVDMRPDLVDERGGFSDSPCGWYEDSLPRMESIGYTISKNDHAAGQCRLQLDIAPISDYQQFLAAEKVQATRTDTGWRFTYIKQDSERASWIEEMTWTIRVHSEAEDVAGLEWQGDGTWLFKGNGPTYLKTPISWTIPN